MNLKKITLSLLILISFSNLFAQNLDFDFIKNAINLSNEEIGIALNSKKFKLIEKEHKNIGDKLINKTDYYSNKTEDLSLEANEETAVFVNAKRSKKTIFISFTKSKSFDNFYSLEEEIKKNFKKEGNLQSEKYESSILKYSNGKILYYLFKEEETYYLIISNNPLEETYFSN